VPRGKFVAFYVYIRKKEKPKINHLSFLLRKLEKEEKLNAQQKINKS
jgi:hypothetical protein